VLPLIVNGPHLAPTAPPPYTQDQDGTGTLDLNEVQNMLRETFIKRAPDEVGSYASHHRSNHTSTPS